MYKRYYVRQNILTVVINLFSGNDRKRGISGSYKGLLG